MLHKMVRGCELDGQKLMAVYAQSNAENADSFYPEETDKKKAIQLVEAGFMNFLENDFLKQEGAACWVWEESGIWVSACRTCRVEPGLYYLEALETRPDSRGNGYAARLLQGVCQALQAEGACRICNCVGKGNTASLRTHQKCGFQIVSECGYDYGGKTSDDRDFGLEFCCKRG